MNKLKPQISGYDTSGQYVIAEELYRDSLVVDTVHLNLRRGFKNYELTNHLGNVMAVISDHRNVERNPLDTNTIKYYKPQFLDFNYLYPYDSIMPGNYTDFGYAFGFNTQLIVDEISGKSKHYTAEFWEYNPRIVKRWNLDPVKKPGRSPYEINSDNPITNDDPNGDCDDCDYQLGGYVAGTYTFGSGGQSYFSFRGGLGGSVTRGDAQAGLNLSVNIYNGGLGTTQGTTGQREMQRDFIMSPSLTFGTGAGAPMPINNFNSMSLSGVTNTFQNSGTIASNFVFNSDGRNQRVGSIGGRFGDFSLNVYNDFFPGIGDLNDRFWTGGGTGNVNLGGSNALSFGTEVFTGLRIETDDEEYQTNPLNPSNGRYGTYAQTTSQQNLNNGQTFFRVTTSDGLRYGLNLSGGANSGYSQALIHDHLPGIKSPVFDYSQSIPSFQLSGGLLFGD